MPFRTALAFVALALAPLAAQAQAGTLRPGEPRSAQLRSGEQASWTVDARAGDRLSATAASGRFDTVLDLYSPSGTLVATDDDGGDGTDSALNDVRLDRAGRYRLVVRAYTDRDGGAYSVRVDLGAGRGGVRPPSRNPSGRVVDAGAIRDGERLTEYLDAGAALQWTFRARAGQRVSLLLTDDGRDIDPTLELYAPGGTLVASDDDGGRDRDSRLDRVRLAESGTYVVLARDFARSRRGDLTLSLALDGRRGADDGYGQDDGTRGDGAGRDDDGDGQGGYGQGGYGQAEDPVGRDVRDRLEPGEQHTVRFDGRRGDVVTVTLASRDFDPEVSLLSPRGAELARNDDADGRNSRISRFRLTESGTHEVVVQAHFSSGSGLYVLRIDR